MSLRNLFITGLLTVTFPFVATATPRSVVLEAIDHARAEIVIVQPDGSEVTYTPSELEKLPNYALTTQTPWRDVAAEFEGVLLRDILDANGLTEASAIVVTAENDFSSTIPRAVWETVDILVATRVDGRPHTRRARGPIQFVIDMDTYQASDVATESHLVWMAARIEAVN